jgi:predicted TPR repeat methyltransferase
MSRKRGAPSRAHQADLGVAMSLHRNGRLDEAESRYQRVLAADPNQVEALHFVGVLHHQRGRRHEAVACIERAIALAPDYVDAHNNLGNVLKETNQLEAALVAYRRAVSLNPLHADAWNNIAVLLRGQGHYDEAETAYARAVRANPAHAVAWQNRGNLLARVGRLEEAAAAYVRALELRPGNTIVYDALGKALYRARKIDQAIHIYRRWLKADPDSSVARHMLAACTGEAIPERASDGYIREVFDAFSGSFDQVLDQLGYRAPRVIADLLDRVLPSPDASLIIADGGCGTGLCGDFLRPRSRRLVGVDLSPGMLARARARNVYDDLIEGELCTWLATQTSVYDLIVSADTFCYFGSLEKPLSAAAHAMRSGGMLVFTVERTDDGIRGFELNASGRYSHSESYVADALIEAELTVLERASIVLRREGGQEVNGLLISAGRLDRSPVDHRRPAGRQ